MLVNVIDERENRYRYRKINAVIEATWHDNAMSGADQSPRNLGGPDYHDMEHVTLESAIARANSYEAPVTLYIYDEHGGLYAREECERLARSLAAQWK